MWVKLYRLCVPYRAENYATDGSDRLLGVEERILLFRAVRLGAAISIADRCPPRLSYQRSPDEDTVDVAAGKECVLENVVLGFKQRG